MSAPASAAGPARQPGRLAATLRSAATAPIAIYQRVISPLLPRRCKYEPTCSRYAVEAIRRFGVARGMVLAAWRVLRCNPWSHGGYDPVEAQRVFGASGRVREPRRPGAHRTATADAGARQGPSCSPPNPV
jgi:putative membrane protein insertion efficiency factor